MPFGELKRLRCLFGQKPHENPHRHEPVTQWIDVFKTVGYECLHWSNIVSPNASDREILLWARTNEFVVFTHDLDFGAILAATSADSPSVLQLRTQNISPKRIGESVLSVFKQFEELLDQGALVSIDEKRARARVLPFSSQR